MTTSCQKVFPPSALTADLERKGVATLKEKRSELRKPFPYLALKADSSRPRDH